MYLLLFFLPVLLGIMAQIMVNSAYYKYRNISCMKSYSGEMVARLLLDRYNLTEVDISRNENGLLGNYYDPKMKTLCFSESVYYGNSIAAISISAHEVAHAIQHDSKFAFLETRNKLLPFLQNMVLLGWICLLVGFLFRENPLLSLGLWIIIGIGAFHVITLPIELQAAKMAGELLEKYGVVEDSIEVEAVHNMTRAISFTYIASIVSIIVLVFRLMKIIFTKKEG